MVINEYETTCIARPNLNDEQVNSIVEKLETIISDFKGDVLVREDWGVRRLAYEISKETRGRYIYWNYVAPANTVAELERIIRIDSDLIRFLTVRLGENVDVDSVRTAATERHEVRESRLAEDREAAERAEAEAEARRQARAAAEQRRSEGSAYDSAPAAEESGEAAEEAAAEEAAAEEAAAEEAAAEEAAAEEAAAEEPAAEEAAAEEEPKKEEE